MRCLDSLSPLMQARPDVRIILVDNASTDADISSLIAAREYPWRERLEIIRSETNRGVAGGRNLGLSHRGESRYLMFLDNDTLVSAKAIEDLIDFMDSHPETGLAAPRLVSPQGKVQKSFKDFPGLKVKISNILGRKNEFDDLVHDGPLHPFYVIGACQIFPSSMVDEIGKLDENIFFGPEDADFCIRVRNSGKEVVYLPHISIIHEWQRDSHKSLFSPVSRAHIKGLLYFYKKWKKWL